MNFVTIDVETANADMASICQVGIACFSDGKLVDEWVSLVNPEDYFYDINISIHGIEAPMVKGAPTLPEIAGRLRGYLEGNVTVCHSHFDRVAVSRACLKYRLEPIETTWLDSARVARRTWRELATTGGYGLANICQKIGYEFKHHNALEDAKAAGHVLLAALQVSQASVVEWLHRVNKPVNPVAASYSPAVKRDGNPEGDLFGEVMVFTGALEISRADAADMAARLGCQVTPNVTKKTTILVVGDQDVALLAGHEKSSKHRRAEEMSAGGQRIRIIRETDFRVLIQSTNICTS